MHFINVQRLDYDDYPVGTPTRIGPFLDESAAGEFMRHSSKFVNRLIFGDYYEWKVVGWGDSHTVSILPVDHGLTNPARWAWHAECDVLD